MKDPEIRAAKEEGPGQSTEQAGQGRARDTENIPQEGDCAESQKGEISI